LGVFISFEGGEGAGKTTQAELLAGRLTGMGRSVVTVREPGGTPMGERLREILLRDSMSPWTEAMLYAAARTELVSQIIVPALRRGDDVVADRFLDSSLAYQGYGRGLDLHVLQRLQDAATAGLRPQLTIWLDIDAGAGLRRANNIGPHDRLERENLEFHQRVREGFSQLARDESRWLRVDASLNLDDIAAQVWDAVERRLSAAGAAR
jgi:dTMP kinase